MESDHDVDMAIETDCGTQMRRWPKRKGTWDAIEQEHGASKHPRSTSRQPNPRGEGPSAISQDLGDHLGDEGLIQMDRRDEEADEGDDEADEERSSADEEDSGADQESMSAGRDRPDGSKGESSTRSSPAPYRQKQLVQSRYAHEGSVTALVYSADGRFLASGGDDCCVVIWDAHRGSIITTLGAHEDIISALAFSPDNRFLVSGAQLPSNTIIIWELGTWAELVHITPQAAAQCLAFTPDPEHSLLVAGNSEGRVETWDMRPDQGYAPVHRLNANAAPIMVMSFSSNGSRMVTGGMDRNCVVWDVETLMPPPPLPPRESPPPIEQAPLSPDVTDAPFEGAATPEDFPMEDETITRPSFRTPYPPIDPARINPVRSWQVGNNGFVYNAALSPDGVRVALAYENGAVEIWCCDPGACERLLTVCKGEVGQPDVVWTLAFSPDGNALATGADSSAVNVFNSYSGMRVRELGGHKGAINALEWAPNGQHLVSAGADSTARVWRVDEEELVMCCNEHDDDVTHTVWSPDGVTIASGSLDGEVRIRLFRRA